MVLKLRLDDDEEENSNEETNTSSSQGPLKRDSNALDALRASIEQGNTRAGNMEATVSSTNERPESASASSSAPSGRGRTLSQSDKITEASLKRPTPSKPSVVDDLADDEEDEFADEREASKAEQLIKEKSSSIKISKKGQMIIIAIILLGLIYVLYQFKGGFSLFPDKDGGVSAPTSPQKNSPAPKTSTKQLTIEEAKAKLQSSYPDYSVELSADQQSFTIAGENDKGTFLATADLQGKVIKDTFTPKKAPTAPSGESAPVDDSKISIDKSDYNKTLLPMKPQTVNKNTTEKLQSQIVKYIIRYEKMPLKGKIPYLFATIDETGEQILFPVSIGEYTSLTDTGSTVVEVTRVKAYGVETLENITLVNWKQMRTSNTATKK